MFSHLSAYFTYHHDHHHALRDSGSHGPFPSQTSQLTLVFEVCTKSYQVNSILFSMVEYGVFCLFYLFDSESKLHTFM
jgi:hypothetical protein